MRIVISVLGKDTVGIIAAVSAVLAERDVNVLTLQQTILEGVFNMVMICESKEDITLIETLQKDFEAVEVDKEVQIKVQHMDIFKSMHQLEG